MPLEAVHLGPTPPQKTPAAGGSGSSGDKAFQPTREELQSIQEKMKDPKFVELLHEYMQSLQDPETRREEEEYLAQAEREAKEGGDFSFEFIFPRAEFVVELVNPTTRRIPAGEVRKVLGGGGGGTPAGGSDGDVKDALTFVNMCSSEKVEQHSEERVGNSRDSNWRVPVSVSAKRLEVLPAASSSSSGEVTATSGHDDHAEKGGGGGRLCYVYDAVFHPTTLSLANRSDKFLCFLVEIAVEHINAGYKESNGFEFRRLPAAVKSVGVPKNQTVRKSGGNGSPFTATKADDPVLAKPTKHLYPEATPSCDAAVDGGQRQLTRAPQERKTTDAAALTGSRLPPHTIAHRGRIDMTDAWQWKFSDRRVGVPEELVVKLTFAGVSKAVALDVDITEDGSAIRIEKTELQRDYEGLLVLPFSVELTPRKAALDKTSGTLTLTLKVVPPQLKAEDEAVAAELRERLLGGAIEPLSQPTTAPATEDATEATGRTAEEREREKTTTEEGEPAKEERRGDSVTTATPAPIAEEMPTATATTTATTSIAAERAAPPPPPPSAEAYTSDTDRARLMMEKVMEARKAREAAAAAAAAASVEVPEETAAEPAPQPAETVMTATAATAELSAPPHEAAAVTAAPLPEPSAADGGEAAEAIPFLQKRDPTREAEERALQERQQAWAAMVKEQMDSMAAKEEAEAQRLAEAEKAKAAKKLAALKAAEAAEARVKAKMAAVPLSNKYIFAID